MSTSFGLLSKVNAITNNKAYSAVEAPTVGYKSYNAQSKVPETPTPNLYNITSLSKGMRIVGNDGGVRYVVAVDDTRGVVLLTGKRANLSNYKKVFTWSASKLADAASHKGFRIAY